MGIITIAAMLSKFDPMNPNNQSAATSAIFAMRRKGRKRKRRWLRECNVVFAKRKGRRKVREVARQTSSRLSTFQGDASGWRGYFVNNFSFLTSRRDVINLCKSRKTSSPTRCVGLYYLK